MGRPRGGASGQSLGPSASAQSRRVKLQRELEACTHEVKELEAKKLATTESILAAQAAAAKQREAKLREFGGGSADLLSDGAVPGSADLLSDDAVPGAPASASADAIADLLGGDLLDGGASASRDLLGGAMAFLRCRQSSSRAFEAERVCITSELSPISNVALSASASVRASRAFAVVRHFSIILRASVG